MEIAEKQKEFHIGKEAMIYIIIDGFDFLVKNQQIGEDNTIDDIYWFPEYYLNILLSISVGFLANLFE